MSPSRLLGVACAPGRAAGRTWTLRAAAVEAQPPPPPLRTVDEAIARVAWHLSQAAEAAVAEGIDLELLHLAEVHRALLMDPLYAGRARQLEASGRAPHEAVRGAVDQAVADLRATGDALLAARAPDLEQLGELLLDAIYGRLPPGRDVPERPVVLVGRDLSPEQLLVLLGPAHPTPTRRVRAVLLERGGPLTHTSVLARQRGVPVVGGLPGVEQRLLPGTAVLVDGDRGVVVVEPDRLTLRAFHHGDEASAVVPSPPPRQVRVLANLDEPEEAALARRAGADGVGLLRTDSLLARGGRAPPVAEQARRYRVALEAWRGERVVIRTFDAPDPAGPEPSLATRGVRWLAAEPARSRAQVEALVEAARCVPETRLCVLLPMVSQAREVAAWRRLVEELWRGEGPAPMVGAMVETPAAALEIDAILDEAELIAIGSNDLLSLLVGASREDPATAALLDPGHRALWRLVGQVAAAGAARGREVVACGAIAADPVSLRRLLDLGVTAISVGLADLAKVRRAAGRERG